MTHLIDGNNLLFAFNKVFMGKAIGRHRLVQFIAKWNRQHDDHVIVFLDGPTPRANLRKQLLKEGVELIFSEHRTADDVLIEWLRENDFSNTCRVVTSDQDVRHRAEDLKADVVAAERFVDELLDEKRPAPPKPDSAKRSERKPESISDEEVDAWIEDMLGEDDELPPYWQI